MAKLILYIPDFRDMSKPVMVVDDVTDFKVHKNGTKSFTIDGKQFKTDCQYAIKVDE